ncbi:MAG TPA: hypothetical protein VN277_07010 [Acidiferrobacterales bacterium]|nr:hypothetical protein [Acidiferrobacterales bacterium]
MTVLSEMVPTEPTGNSIPSVAAPPATPGPVTVLRVMLSVEPKHPLKRLVAVFLATMGRTAGASAPTIEGRIAGVR